MAAKKVKKGIEGYKIFNISKNSSSGEHLECRGYNYGKRKTIAGTEVKEYGTPMICNHGFHFCKELVDCFRYYTFDPSTMAICKVASIGKTSSEPDKTATCHLKIVKELSIAEIRQVLDVQLYDKKTVIKNELCIIRKTKGGSFYIRPRGGYGYKAVPAEFAMDSNVGCQVRFVVTEKFNKPLHKARYKQSLHDRNSLLQRGLRKIEIIEA